MYSFGQLRFFLVAGAAGVSHDLIDSYINTRYAFILDFYPWKGLEAETALQTAAAYTTGTVTVTQGSAAVVGAGTAWTAAVDGFRFEIGNGGPLYTAAIGDATDLTLDRPYEGDSAAMLAYNLFQNAYLLPGDCKAILSITNPTSGHDLGEWTGAQMEQAENAMALGDPLYYAVSEDTPETSPPVLHEVELYPAPLTSRAFPLRYQKAANGFTGENTWNAPLPWVSDECLLNGCRADIQAHLASQEGSTNSQAHLASAKGYEAEFVVGLAAMVRQDNLRRPQQTMTMDPRYTRYRSRRVTR